MSVRIEELDGPPVTVPLAREDCFEACLKNPLDRLVDVRKRLLLRSTLADGTRYLWCLRDNPLRVAT